MIPSFEHLTNGDRAAAIVFFVAIALVFVGLWVFFLRPLSLWRRDRDRLPRNGETWRSATSRERFCVRFGLSGAEIYHDGMLIFLADSRSEWRKFSEENRLYCEEGKPR